MNLSKYIFPTLAVLLFITSCRKKPDEIVAETKKTAVSLTIENYADGKLLEFDTKYVNAHGDSFSVFEYMYYISNIKLIKDDGTEYKEPESYHLVDQEKPASKNFTITDVPEGNYTKISFLIGVDSTRNVSGAQTGALSPENTMFWTWKTGYIMAKIGGECSVAGNGLYSFHIAGFTQPHSVLRWVTLALPGAIVVKAGSTPNVHIANNVAEWFKTPAVIDLSKLNTIGLTGPDAVKVADNYADMFSITKVE